MDKINPYQERNWKKIWKKLQLFHFTSTAPGCGSGWILRESGFNIRNTKPDSDQNTILEKKPDPDPALEEQP